MVLYYILFITNVINVRIFVCAEARPDGGKPSLKTSKMKTVERSYQIILDGYNGQLIYNFDSRKFEANPVNPENTLFENKEDAESKMVSLVENDAGLDGRLEVVECEDEISF